MAFILAQSVQLHLTCGPLFTVDDFSLSCLRCFDHPRLLAMRSYTIAHNVSCAMKRNATREKSQNSPHQLGCIVKTLIYYHRYVLDFRNTLAHVLSNVYSSQINSSLSLCVYFRHGEFS